MPIYEFEAPDGKIYEVEAPEGVSPDAAYQDLANSIGLTEPQPEPETQQAPRGGSPRMRQAARQR